jgi:hypothetical protein
MDSREFWSQVAAQQRKGCRRGQAVFNVAYEMDETACDDACDKVGDPFNDESKVIAFVSELHFDS